ncbi:hypothetical protein ACP70R_019353 [Stipagrostis hirtigluma subsp. patula]
MYEHKFLSCFKPPENASGSIISFFLSEGNTDKDLAYFQELFFWGLGGGGAGGYFVPHERLKSSPAVPRLGHGWPRNMGKTRKTFLWAAAKDLAKGISSLQQIASDREMASGNPRQEQIIKSGQLPTPLNCWQLTGLKELIPYDVRFEQYIKEANLDGFIQMVRNGLPPHDRELVSSCIDRFNLHTRTFWFPCGEAKITLQDVSMLTTLPVDV